MTDTPQTVLLNATLIDGRGGEPIPNSAVVIDGDRIAYAGPRAGARWGEGARVRDVAGLTVLPGLIDCHDHVAHPGLDLARRSQLPYSFTVYETARTLAETLAVGITTVRDAGGLDYGAKLAVERGLTPGPRLMVSLAILCPTAGLGDPCCPSGMQFPDSPGLPNGVRNGIEDCRLGVREMGAVGRRLHQDRLHRGCQLTAPRAAGPAVH